MLKSLSLGAALFDTANGRFPALSGPSSRLRHPAGHVLAPWHRNGRGLSVRGVAAPIAAADLPRPNAPPPRGWAGLFWGAFKRSQTGMVLVDDGPRHVEVNGAYLSMVGYRRNQLIGRPVYEIVEGGPLLSDAEWQAVLARREAL